MSYFSIIVSGVASLGVFVALISGIFFLVLFGLRWVSKVRSAFYEEELLRHKRRLLSKSCFNRDGRRPLMETKKNHQSFSPENQLRNVSENLKDEREEKNNKKESKIAPHTLLFRELIEKKIEELIGGSLDGVPVGRCSTHSSYLALFCKYHSLLCQEIEKLGLALQSSILNENVIDSEVLNYQILDLKKLLKEIISDILSMPTITETLFDNKITNSTNYDDFHDKTYEDILATAILNKVIGHFQNSNDADILTLCQSNCQNGKSSEKHEEESVSNSDSSDFSQMEDVSFTLEEHIEEINNEYVLSEDDETVEDCEFESNFDKSSFLEHGNVLENDSYDDHVLKKTEEQIAEQDMISSVSSWEDNWLFQKKRFRSTPNVHHPVPVPMLVPKPSNSFRALVGGIDADDLSDMSDCSDSVFESRLITLTDTDTEDLSDENDKVKNESTVNHMIDQMTDTSKSLKLCSTDFDPESKCDSKEIQKPKEFFSKNLENTYIDDRNMKEEYLNCCKNFDSDITYTKVQPNALSESEEEEELEHVKEKEEIKIQSNSKLISDIQGSSVNIKKKEHIKENEYYSLGTNFNELLNFPDDAISSFSNENKSKEYRVLRDFYVNASENPSGMISPKTLTPFTEEIEQVYTSSNNTSFSEEYSLTKIQEDNENKILTNNFNKKKIFALPNVKQLAEQFMKYECPISTQAVINREIKVEDKSLIKPKSLDAIKSSGKQVHSLTARSISKEFREGLKSNSYQKSSVKTSGETRAENIICQERTPSPTPSINLQNIKKFWEDMIMANSTLQN